MILYTIVPQELIFGRGEEGIEKNYIEMEYMGEKVLVTPLQNNEYQINRLISTSPKAFLNPQLQPGNIIKAKFEQ